MQRMTSMCRVCGGKLSAPVPHHYDYHQTCEPCLQLAWLREAYRPATRAEHEWRERFPIVITRRAT